MADRETLDVLTMGRVVIDLYPLDANVPLDQVDTFGRFLGGSPTNVAVAAARLGHRAAVITRTGADPFATFIHAELKRLGVRDEQVTAVAGTRSTLAFCELFPPDDFPLYFFHDPTPPDLMIDPRELDLTAIAEARVFWTTLTGLSRQPSRDAHDAAWRARGRRRHTVLDLDFRPSFWESSEQASAEGRRALQHVTVALGNLKECEVVLGEGSPERAADALLEAGVELAIVKLGPAGVLAKTRQTAVTVPAIRIDVVNGLGAGDGFGGAVCHGLLLDLEIEEALRFASAAGAIVASRRGCSTAMPTREEVEVLLEQVARGVDG